MDIYDYRLYKNLWNNSSRSVSLKMSSLLLIGVILCSSAFGSLNGPTIQKHDRNHIHEKSYEHHHKSHERFHQNAQEKHHHRLLRHHLKTRDATPGIFIPINNTKLIALVKWFNNTNELKFLYQILPPSVKHDIFKDINATLANLSVTNANTTLFNETTNANLNTLYDSSAEYPILTYIARLFGFFLSRFHGFIEMCNFFPTFTNIWRIFLQGIMGGCGRREILIENLLNLFGFNGTFGGNLFNFSSWSPLGVIHGFEHAVETGLANLANLSNL